MGAERLVMHHALAGPFTLVAMREQDEAAIPLRRHIDQIRRAAQHALIAPRCMGGSAEWKSDSECQHGEKSSKGSTSHQLRCVLATAVDEMLEAQIFGTHFRMQALRVVKVTARKNKLVSKATEIYPRL